MQITPNDDDDDDDDDSITTAGPTPPAARRMLPPVDEADRKQVSDILARKSSSKKRPGPPPPRRTTSVKDPPDYPDLDLELKSRILKLQKARGDNSMVVEEEILDTSSKLSREDTLGKSAADNLKAAQIDRSKYLISEANARSFEHGTPERSSGRKPGFFAGLGKPADGGDGSGQYPKKAVVMPQRSGFASYKMSDSSRSGELVHSQSVEEEPEQVRRC